jgi:hypothetical protein
VDRERRRRRGGATPPAHGRRLAIPPGRPRDHYLRGARTCWLCSRGGVEVDVSNEPTVEKRDVVHLHDIALHHLELLARIDRVLDVVGTTLHA